MATITFDKYRASLAIAGAFIVTFLLFQGYYHPQIWQNAHSRSAQPSVDPASSVRNLLAPHMGDSHFRYTRKHIRVSHGYKPDNRSLPPLDQAFDPYFVATADLGQDSLEETLYQIGTPQTLDLELPSPQYREHKAKLMFGLATDVQRLSDNLEHMQLWMKQKGVHVFVLVPPDSRAKEMEKNWQKFGIDITIVEREASFFDRLLSCVPDMLELAQSKYNGQIDWYTVLDDDTFVPSVTRFASTLAGYDHERPFYIGGISEPKADLSGIGYFAYGGAGMVFSSALVEELAPHIPDCIKTANVNWGGDGRLAECVSKYTRTRLTYLRDLHQMDIVGDQSGIYESGFKPLTLHHWRGWADIPMAKVAEVASLTGGRGLFQRFRFSDGYVLTNGYSLVRYEALSDSFSRQQRSNHGDEDSIDFSKMEFTWDNGAMWEFDHSLGPFRDRLSSREKKSWMFVDSLTEGKAGAGPVRQLYLNKEEGKLPEAIELIWTT